MSRARAKIGKWNRRGERARARKLHEELSRSAVTVYQPPVGFRLVPIEEPCPRCQPCPNCGGCTCDHAPLAVGEKEA